MTSEAISLSELCFQWPPTSLSRRSLRFTARKRLPRIVRIPASGQRLRRWPEAGIQRMVGRFDPSPEPLRPMGQAHRGVTKARRPPSQLGASRSSLGQGIGWAKSSLSLQPNPFFVFAIRFCGSCSCRESCQTETLDWLTFFYFVS